MSEEPRRPSPFARYLRERRKALGLSQEDLARLAGEGIIGSYVAKLERDDVETPPPARLRALARALDVPTSDFGRLIYHDEGARLPKPVPPPEPSIFDDPSVDKRVKHALRAAARWGASPEQLRVLAAALTATLGQGPREETERRLGPTKEPDPDLDRGDQHRDAG